MLAFLFFICGVIHCTIGQEVYDLNTPKVNLGFALTYDNITENLYGVDYLKSDFPLMFRYNIRNGEFYSADIVGVDSLSFIIPIQKRCETCTGLFAVAADRDVLIVSWDGFSDFAQVVDILFSVVSDDISTIINYGRADSKGRLYFGTISREFCDSTGQQSFFRYSADRGVDRIFNGVYSTAGIAINEFAQKLYHLDLCTLLLTEFDWDPATGDICNGRVAYDFKSIGAITGLFVPIGMEIGSDGLLYISNYRESIIVVDPWSNSVIDVLSVGISGVAGTAFAGEALYLVGGSSLVNVLDGTLTRNRQGSSLYAVSGLGVTGRGSTYLRIP